MLLALDAVVTVLSLCKQGTLVEAVYTKAATQYVNVRGEYAGEEIFVKTHV